VCTENLSSGVVVVKSAQDAPRQGNDRLLLGLKGSLNEYELDLLRHRSLSARYEKARRGELIVAAPVGFVNVIRTTTPPVSDTSNAPGTTTRTVAVSAFALPVSVRVLANATEF
jgi:DNA invertase Pin-like site-specific DNA recombinase